MSEDSNNHSIPPTSIEVAAQQHARNWEEDPQQLSDAKQQKVPDVHSTTTLGDTGNSHAPDGEENSHAHDHIGQKSSGRKASGSVSGRHSRKSLKKVSKSKEDGAVGSDSSVAPAKPKRRHRRSSKITKLPPNVSAAIAQSQFEMDDERDAVGEASAGPVEAGEAATAASAPGGEVTEAARRAAAVEERVKRELAAPRRASLSSKDLLAKYNGSQARGGVSIREPVVQDEIKKRTLAEAQLEAVRAQCKDLAGENARLAVLCNDLSFRLTLEGVPINPTILKSQPVPSLNFSASDPNHKGLCCMRLTNAVRPNPYALPPSMRDAIEDRHVPYLCTIGPAMKLASLSLSGSLLTDHGITLLCRGLRGLRELDLSQCLGITDAIGPMIGSALLSLEALDVSYTSISSDGLGYLSMLPCLREIRCRGCDKVDDEALQAFSNKDTLNAVDLSGTRVSHRSVGRIDKELVNLTCLGLAGCDIEDKSVLAISKLKGLRCLNLSYCVELTDTGVRFLEDHLHLTALDISHTEIDLENIEWLGRMRNLRYLNVGHTGTVLYEQFSHHKAMAPRPPPPPPPLPLAIPAPPLSTETSADQLALSDTLGSALSSPRPFFDPNSVPPPARAVAPPQRTSQPKTPTNTIMEAGSRAPRKSSLKQSTSTESRKTHAGTEKSASVPESVSESMELTPFVKTHQPEHVARGVSFEASVVWQEEDEEAAESVELATEPMSGLKLPPISSASPSPIPDLVSTEESDEEEHPDVHEMVPAFVPGVIRRQARMRSAAGGMKNQRTMVGGFVRNMLVPLDDPETHLQEKLAVHNKKSKRAPKYRASALEHHCPFKTMTYTSQTQSGRRREAATLPPMRTVSSEQRTSLGTGQQPEETAMPVIVAKLRSSLQQDMTFQGVKNNRLL